VSAGDYLLVGIWLLIIGVAVFENVKWYRR
jgi:hypothetical protein